MTAFYDFDHNSAYLASLLPIVVKNCDPPQILFNGAWYASVMLLWGAGLRLVGPIRTVLLFDHHETIVLACISYLIAG